MFDVSEYEKLDDEHKAKSDAFFDGISHNGIP